MALLERRCSERERTDDTETLSCTIEAAQTLHSYTEYIIRIQRGPDPKECWQIVKRYSDFDTLNTILQVSGVAPTLPPKRLIGKLDREFVSQRQRGLQAYLDTLLAQPCLACCENVRRFLDPTSYPDSYTELALQQVSMFFRSEPRWEVLEPLKDIGWRIRKRFFLLRPKDQPKARLLLSWAEVGPDSYLSQKDLQAALKLLPNISHPHLQPIVLAEAGEKSALLVQPFNETGALRDLLCKSRPGEPYLRSCRRKGPGLPLSQLQSFGCQILEALNFLHECGFPYGHLHSGNVLVQGKTCRLTGLENSILGLPPLYRAELASHRRLAAMEVGDVFAFGLLLFELAYGRPPDTIPVETFEPSIPPLVASVLQSILSADAVRSCLPTVPMLLDSPLFHGVPLPRSEKPHLKMTSRLKESLRGLQESTEQRLRRDNREKSRQSLNEDPESPLANGATDSTLSSPTTTPSTPTPTGSAPPPPPPLLSPSPTAIATNDSGPARGALLSSIRNFQKGILRSAAVDNPDCDTEGI
uniref:PX domain containing serine/threonine kinase n=1 Tax=Eptatretus burgeri TaxID=7764 RepID=A0A8C4X1U9_EPTBU